MNINQIHKLDMDVPDDFPSTFLFLWKEGGLPDRAWWVGFVDFCLNWPQFGLSCVCYQQFLRTSLSSACHLFLLSFLSLLSKTSRSTFSSLVRSVSILSYYKISFNLSSQPLAFNLGSHLMTFLGSRWTFITLILCTSLIISTQQRYHMSIQSNSRLMAATGANVCTFKYKHDLGNIGIIKTPNLCCIIWIESTYDLYKLHKSWFRDF